MKVAWWPHTTDARVASFRLRCLQVVEQLNRDGGSASIFQPGAEPPEVLVLSKRYDAKSMDVARSVADSHGTRLILDLCDNHFHHASGADPALARRAADLRNAVASVNLVTTASGALAEIVRSECPTAAPIIVVDDAAEQPYEPAWPERWRNWRAEAALRGLTSWLRSLPQVPKERRLVWFGNHGSPGVEAGLTDLARLYPLLQRAAQAAPLSLTIISNHAEKAANTTRGWAVATRYLEWNASTFSRALREHSVVLIPINPNPFTRCKTANRVLSAFMHGLNVVGDSIPSYEPFASCAVLDDWDFGLGPYLSMHAKRQHDVAEGSALAHERYSLPHVASQWRHAAECALHAAPAQAFTASTAQP